MKPSSPPSVEVMFWRQKSTFGSKSEFFKHWFYIFVCLVTFSENTSRILTYFCSKVIENVSHILTNTVFWASVGHYKFFLHCLVSYMYCQPLLHTHHHYCWAPHFLLYMEDLESHHLQNMVLVFWSRHHTTWLHCYHSELESENNHKNKLNYKGITKRFQ